MIDRQDTPKLTVAAPTIGRGKGGVVSTFDCFRPKEPFNFRMSNFLPHLEQLGTLSFITFRLFDSLPALKLKEWETSRDKWLAENQESWDTYNYWRYVQLFGRKNRLINHGAGECWLKYKETQQIVENALRYLDGNMFDLYEFVIMPNHVHMIIMPYEANLSSIMKTLKGYTALNINKCLCRSGVLWSRDYFDHLIRSVQEYEEIAQYIKDNPKSN